MATYTDTPYGDTILVLAQSEFDAIRHSGLLELHHVPYLTNKEVREQRRIAKEEDEALRMKVNSLNLKPVYFYPVLRKFFTQYHNGTVHDFDNWLADVADGSINLRTYRKIGAKGEREILEAVRNYLANEAAADA